jgi:Tol biopolymer transport system component
MGGSLAIEGGIRMRREKHKRKTLSRSVRVSIVAALFLSLLIVGGMAARAMRSARLGALFEGRYEVCKREEPAYYPRAVYDLSEYLKTEDESGAESSSEGARFVTETGSGEIPWVDGEAREDVNAALRRRSQETSVDGATGATPVARLRSPSVYRHRRPFRSLQIVYPEDGSLFPPNLCPPHVEWEDPRNDLWQVIVEAGEGSERATFLSRSKRWRFPARLWRLLRREAVTRDARLQIKGLKLTRAGRRVGEVQASEILRFRISRDPADNYIVYRLVSPPFSSSKTPDLFVRDIREDKPRLFLSARRKYCVNCHTFSSKRGNAGKLSLQVRSLAAPGQKLPVYLGLYDIDRNRGYRIQLPFEVQMTTFMAWSPDGKKLAFSANQKIAALQPLLYETQLAGMSTSDIAVYELTRNEAYLLPGGSDPNMLEIYPRWSPDGHSIVFSQCPVGAHPAYMYFDLYAIPFDAGKDSVAQPIEGASANERSNYFARFSPDGTWLSFCQCDGGDLIRSSSDIYLKPGNLKGPARRLECNVPYAADSWHSWSSNSRWLVWASKRDGGIYAYLYLTHIDPDGRASPAIRLPMKKRPDASFNIPEFVAEDPGIREASLFEAIRAEQEPLVVKERKVKEGHGDAEEKGDEA